MSELLPSQSSASSEQSGELQALWLDSEEAGDLLSSLSCDTARAILTTLHDEPATASEVAESVDTSLQNARHHLSNLAEAGLVRVAETRYSAKGREMNVYAPSEDPTVVFVGNRESEASSDEGGGRAIDALRELLPALGLLAVASLFAQWWLTLSTGGTVSGELPRFGQSMTAGGGALATVPPGVLVLAGGLLVAACTVAFHRYRG